MRAGEGEGQEKEGVLVERTNLSVRYILGCDSHGSPPLASGLSRRSHRFQALFLAATRPLSGIAAGPVLRGHPMFPLPPDCHLVTACVPLR